MNSKSFEELWQEADEIDALTGGLDSIPEEERYDYGMAWVLNAYHNDDDLRRRREKRKYGQ